MKSPHLKEASQVCDPVYHWTPHIEYKSTVIVSTFGGGVNSTGKLIGMRRFGVRPDAIVFADTGGEQPETYKIIESFSAWLKKNDFPEITVVRAPHTTLEADILERRALPAVAYGFKTCSLRFKTQPVDVFINNFQPALDSWARGEKVIRTVGFDTEEMHRAKAYSDSKYEVIYPLIEWGWSRKDCERVCHEEGFYPRKSSCFFCPNMKTHEIKRLVHEHPDLAERAIAIERNAELSTIKGLGRRWSWEALIKADRDQLKMFEDAIQDMPCSCYDG